MPDDTASTRAKNQSETILASPSTCLNKPDHLSGRHPGGARPRPPAAAAPGVRPAPRRRRAKQDCEREVAKRWLERHGSRCAATAPRLPGRRPVRLPARLPGDARQRRRLPAHRQAGQPPDPLRVPRRHPPAHPPRHRRRRRPPAHPPLPVDDRPAHPRRRRRPARQLAGDHQRATRRHRHLPRHLRHQPRRRPRHVAELADCARARWKIENETFNVLKQHGYHLEHNFGHGNDTLAGVLVVLNLLAFSLHSACELAETLWQSARRRLGTRRRLFEHLRTVTEYRVFPDWNDLLSLLATGGTAAQPP